MGKENIKSLSGIFTFKDGKLDFVCSNINVPFEEVRECFIALQKEIQRQLDNQDKCPFNIHK